MNAFKQRLLAGERLVGYEVDLCDPCICEMVGQAGFDYIWIDTEHSAMDYHTVLMQIIAAKAGGAASVVRIPWNVLRFATGGLKPSPGIQATTVRPLSDTAFATRVMSPGWNFSRSAHTSSPPRWMNGIFSLGASEHSSSTRSTSVSTTPSSRIDLKPNARRNASACPGMSNSGMTVTPRAAA